MIPEYISLASVLRLRRSETRGSTELVRAVGRDRLDQIEITRQCRLFNIPIIGPNLVERSLVKKEARSNIQSSSYVHWARILFIKSRSPNSPFVHQSRANHVHQTRDTFIGQPYIHRSWFRRLFIVHQNYLSQIQQIHSSVHTSDLLPPLSHRRSVKPPIESHVLIPVNQETQFQKEFLRSST